MTYEHEREEFGYVRPAKIISAPFPALDPNHQVSMDDYLEKRGLNYLLARANGWYPSTSAGDIEPRIVIPALSLIEGHNFWQARAMVYRGEDVKRYQSPYGSRMDALIFVAPRSLHTIKLGGWHKAIIVEGPMDALAAAGEGYLGIALMGNTPSEAVLEHLVRVVQHRPTIILADSDAVAEAALLAGKLAAAGAYTILKPCRGWKDLADVPKSMRAVLLEQ